MVYLNGEREDKRRVSCCDPVLYHMGSNLERIIKGALHKYSCVSILWEETGNKKEGKSISSLCSLLDLSLHTA